MVIVTNGIREMRKNACYYREAKLRYKAHLIVTLSTEPFYFDYCDYALWDYVQNTRNKEYNTQTRNSI